MTMTPELRAFLMEQPGRCHVCCAHVESQKHNDGCIEGERLKAEAYARLDANDPAGESVLLRREIVALGRRYGRFTPDDLAPELRAATNPNRRGRIFSALIDEGVIREVDRVKSANPKAHGKTVGVYELVAA